MIPFSNGGWWVETADELPELPAVIDRLYLDFETSSNDKNRDSLNPWDSEHCTVIGAAVTWDDHPCSYFVERELLLSSGFLRRAFDAAVNGSWRNNNIKYDVHVAENDLGEVYHGEYQDIISKAKVYDADRTYKGGYGLGVLSKQLLGRDIDYLYDRMAPYLRTEGPVAQRNKDYGNVPRDMLAEYACQDPLSSRELDEWLDTQLPEESAFIVNQEARLIGALLDIERHGMYANLTEIKIALCLNLKRIAELDDELAATLPKRYKKKKRKGIEYETTIERPYLPTSYNDCEYILLRRCGFPSIYNEKPRLGGVIRASFDKDTLKAYCALTAMPAEALRMAALILEYRTLAHTNNLFWKPWLEMADADGTLHPSYNPNVRSGRLSCSKPNAQQLHLNAKKQVRSKPGRKLMCWDYSQLEYRWMAHYLGNKRAIDSYNNDPTTDWHQWVADELCGGIKRRPAKTLNFTIGFGGGKKRVTHMLSLDKDIIEQTGGDLIKVRERATEIFNSYHRNLPELKQHSRMCENAVERTADPRNGGDGHYGYVKTLYKRRLHLPLEFKRKGFNRVVQSTAADNAKEAMCNVSPRYNTRLHELDIHLIAQVHDEYVFDFPDDDAIIEEGSKIITAALEAPGKRIGCRVPIIAHHGNPGKNWAEAKPA